MGREITAILVSDPNRLARNFSEDELRTKTASQLVKEILESADERARNLFAVLGNKIRKEHEVYIHFAQKAFSWYRLDSNEPVWKYLRGINKDASEFSLMVYTLNEYPHIAG